MADITNYNPLPTSNSVFALNDGFADVNKEAISSETDGKKVLLGQIRPGVNKFNAAIGKIGEQVSTLHMLTDSRSVPLPKALGQQRGEALLAYDSLQGRFNRAEMPADIGQPPSSPQTLPQEDIDARVQLLFHQTKADINTLETDMVDDSFIQALGVSVEEKDSMDHELFLIRKYVENYSLYESGVQRYSKFFSDFTDFMSGITKHLIVTDDKGNERMHFDREVINQIIDLIDLYQKDPKTNLFPASGGTSKQEAQKWADEWGLDPSCVVEVGKTGTYVVKVDLAPLENILKDLLELGEMNSFQYSAWRSGFDGQADKIKNTIQILMTKLSDAFNTKDLRIKQVFTAMQALADLIQKLYSMTR